MRQSSTPSAAEPPAMYSIRRPRFLPPARDEDMRSFVDEQLGAGQRQATRAARDHRDLAIELSHDHSIEQMDWLCTPICVLNVSDGRPGRKLCTPSGTQLG